MASIITLFQLAVFSDGLLDFTDLFFSTVEGCSAVPRTIRDRSIRKYQMIRSQAGLVTLTPEEKDKYHFKETLWQTLVRNNNQVFKNQASDGMKFARMIVSLFLSLVFEFSAIFFLVAIAFTLASVVISMA